MLLVSFVGFWFFQYRAKRLAGKNVFEMTHFLSSGTCLQVPSVTNLTMLASHHCEVDMSCWLLAKVVCESACRRFTVAVSTRSDVDLLIELLC